ncbi:hypothetical protein FB451DRAFT_1378083 [Mycena latifolia]|nr:hypothetical protein FB451DRAFT_1378083 [Mycena latifolia]
MFRQPSNFSVRTQARILMACGIIHNFIRLHDPDDADDNSDSEEEMEDNPLDGASQSDIHPEDLSSGISEEETARAEEKRDIIAKAMWESYIEELERRANNLYEPGNPRLTSMTGDHLEKRPPGIRQRSRTLQARPRRKDNHYGNVCGRLSWWKPSERWDVWQASTEEC